MLDWLATIVGAIASAALVYALGTRQRRRREERGARAERRKRRAEKRDRERFEQEREQTSEREAEDEDYRDFVAEVHQLFEMGGRSFAVEFEDQDLGMRSGLSQTRMA